MKLTSYNDMDYIPPYSDFLNMAYFACLNEIRWAVWQIITEVQAGNSVIYMEGCDYENIGTVCKYLQNELKLDITPTTTNIGGYDKILRLHIEL